MHYESKIRSCRPGEKKAKSGVADHLLKQHFKEKVEEIFVPSL